MNHRLLASAAALAAIAATSGCTNVSSLDCNEIAQHARRISQDQQLKITEIRNARETSRSEREARCTAEASFSDNRERELELRAYYQGDNTMVEYSEVGGSRGNAEAGRGSDSGSEGERGSEAERGSQEESGSEEGGESR